MQNWDYAAEGSYFITGNTYEMIPFFGDIRNEEMFLSEEGKIAHKNLEEIPRKYAQILLDIFQIMPNHFHAIFTIDNSRKIVVKDFTDYILGQTAENFFLLNPLKFQKLTDDKKRGGCTGIHNPMLHQNLSTIM